MLESRKERIDKANRLMYKNIYYMLCYAVDELKNMNISDSDLENISSSDELLATLLLKTLKEWDRFSPLKSYKEVNVVTDKPTGRLNIYESYTSGVIRQGKINCTQYKLDIDTLPNKVIKLAIRIMLSYSRSNFDKAKRAELDKYYELLSNVSNITVSDYYKSKVEYNTLPSYYKPVISASRIIIDNMIAYDKDGIERLYELPDSKRCKYIFEKFVRRFYQLEYSKNGTVVKHPVYDRSELKDGSYCDRLDVLLINKERALIIDTKWYITTSDTDNKHQISEYVHDVNENETVEKSITGIVLYAHRDIDKIGLGRFNVTDIKNVKAEAFESTIKINQDFNKIKETLISIADKYLI